MTSAQIARIALIISANDYASDIRNEWGGAWKVTPSENGRILFHTPYAAWSVNADGSVYTVY